MLAFQTCRQGSPQVDIVYDVWLGWEELEFVSISNLSSVWTIFK